MGKKVNGGPVPFYFKKSGVQQQLNQNYNHIEKRSLMKLVRDAFGTPSNASHHRDITSSASTVGMQG
eukprot:1144218-Pelagomonas_calceolata.AAC.2